MADNHRILYLDCFSGISGDMFLGALLDAGASETAVRKGLALLPISGEYQVLVETAVRDGVTGTSFTVQLEKAGHHGATYQEICQLIDESPLSPAIRQLALLIFRTIGEAEAAVHGIPLADVHFHEVGAIDSIVDIVGAAIALENLSVDEIICSTVHDGSGTIMSQHGLLPVPVPAVLKMLEGTSIPFKAGTAGTELVTPTGMGLVKSLCSSFGFFPDMMIKKVGYGFGQREIGRLNALRVVIGESDEPAKRLPATNPYMDQVLMLCANLDNSTPEQLGYAADRLMQAGAYDVAFEPLMMKKWRPGQLIRVVAPLDLENLLVRLIFELTGTIGVRRQVIERHIMQREIQTVSTILGTVRYKINRWHDLHKDYPEQEDLIRIAENAGISPLEAEKLIRAALDNQDAD